MSRMVRIYRVLKTVFDVKVTYYNEDIENVNLSILEIL